MKPSRIEIGRIEQPGGRKDRQHPHQQNHHDQFDQGEAILSNF